MKSKKREFVLKATTLSFLFVISSKFVAFRATNKYFMKFRLLDLTFENTERSKLY